MDYNTQRTPIEELFSESYDQEDDPFNSMSTCAFDGSTGPFVSQIIYEILPMNNNTQLNLPPNPVVPQDTYPALEKSDIASEEP